MPLRVSLLGSFQVHLETEPVTQFRFHRVRALLAYLATEKGTVHERTELISLLWPEIPPKTALTNLRQALTTLRQTLRDQEQPAPFLLTTAQTVQVNPACHFWLDVTIFSQIMESTRRHRHRRLLACTHCLAQLEHAVALYRGDFLTDILVDSEPFEYWVRARREQLHVQVMQALATVGDHYQRHQQWLEAIANAQRQVVLDPLSDAGNQQLMVALAAHGQRQAAIRQYGHYRDLLDIELDVAPPVTITQFWRQLQTPAEVATRDQPVPPHSLPAAAPLLGYQAELSFIAQCLATVDCRLLTITGPVGVGKSRVALAAAWREIRNFRDGVYYLDLRSAAGRPLRAEIAATLAQGGQDVPSEPDRLTAWLRDKELLVVLDNFDEARSAAPDLPDLLNQAPLLSLLVTSREWLHLKAETALVLRGLALPTATSATKAEASDSVQFFLQAARRWHPDFHLAAPEDLAAVVEICQLTGGLPLALELAAYWVRLLPPAEIAARLVQSLDLPPNPMVDWPGRQRSLPALCALALERLSPAEQAVFLRLCVFESSFRPEAAHTVAVAAAEDLQSLQAKSLLLGEPTHAAAAGLGERRYEIPVLFRGFGIKLLEQQVSGAVRELNDRHGRYYVELLERQTARLEGAGRPDALRTIEAEMKNIHQARRWAAAQKSAEAIKRIEAGLARVAGAQSTPLVSRPLPR